MRLDWELRTQDPLALTEKLAKPFESCRLSAYWDDAGYPTNGWGNLLSRTTKRKLMQDQGFTSKQADTWLQATYPPITQDKADEDFRINLNKAFSSVKRLVKIPLSMEQLAALTDFTFNCGGGNLQTSTLLRMVNRGDLLDAAEQFPKWNKAGGIVMRGLTRRRLAEKRLFLSGM